MLIQCAVIPRNAARVVSADQQSVVAEIRPGACYVQQLLASQYTGAKAMKISTYLEYISEVLNMLDEGVVDVGLHVVGRWEIKVDCLWAHCD